MSEFLTREQILGLDDRKVEVLNVPGWGKVRIREISAKQRGEFEAYVSGDYREVTKGKSKQRIQLSDARAMLAQMSLVDENNKPLFQRKDIAELGRKSAIALDYVFDQACRLSGIGQDIVDDLEKNSESDHSES